MSAGTDIEATPNLGCFHYGHRSALALPGYGETTLTLRMGEIPAEMLDLLDINVGHVDGTKKQDDRRPR